MQGSKRAHRRYWAPGGVDTPFGVYHSHSSVIKRIQNIITDAVPVEIQMVGNWRGLRMFCNSNIILDVEQRGPYYERKHELRGVFCLFDYYSRVPKEDLYTLPSTNIDIETHPGATGLMNEVNNYFGVIPLLKSLDRRIGKRRLKQLRTDFIIDVLSGGHIPGLTVAVEMINLRLNESNEYITTSI